MPDPSPPTLAPHPTLSKYYAEPGQKRAFVGDVFDKAAGDYDKVERLMALGSGSWYRRQALKRAGLAAGMRVLDVAVGTGLVAREEIAIVGSPQLVIGLDPSIGMMSQAVKSLKIPAILALGEQIPLADQSVDFLSMGYALRHLSDLAPALREFYRVLKPGGRLCVLEITRPRGRVSLGMMKFYMRYIVPALTRLTRGGRDSKILWQYYWDTIDQCVEPRIVMEALQRVGFAEVNRHVELRIFSEYTARRPA